MEVDSLFIGESLTFGTIYSYNTSSYIELYSDYYPNICKKVDIVSKSNISLITREFWNVTINEKIDHVILNVRYTFDPPNAISYEVIGGYEKAIGIMNAITLNKNTKGMTYVIGNSPFLDVICYPPHLVEMDDYSYRRYTDFIDYFVEMDCIHLENKPLQLFKENSVCIKCKIGHLEKTIKKEEYSNAKGTFRKRTEFWLCDNCGQEFKQYKVHL